MALLTLNVPDEILERITREATQKATEAVWARLEAHPDAWLDTRAAAEHLSCRKSRVYELVQMGLPHRKDGSRLLFRASELDHWIERGGGKRP